MRKGKEKVGGVLSRVCLRAEPPLQFVRLLFYSAGGAKTKT